MEYHFQNLVEHMVCMDRMEGMVANYVDLQNKKNLFLTKQLLHMIIVDSGKYTSLYLGKK